MLLLPAANRPRIVPHAVLVFVELLLQPSVVVTISVNKSDWRKYDDAESTLDEKLTLPPPVLIVMSAASTASNTGPVNVTAPPAPEAAVVLIVKAFC